MATCPDCRKVYPDNVSVCPDDGVPLLADAAFAGTDADLKPGQMVGEYEVVGTLGAGGFGTVYRARQPLIGKEVAIKLLNREYSSNPQMVSRFIEEARAVNQIRHRNIIDIFSFGMLEDKRQYFVMEFLDGQPLDEYLRGRGRLPPEEAVPILRQVARALDAAHARGIAHRDLKPENVYLTFDDDGRAFPKLLDFGIAKLLGHGHTSGHRTATGQPIGTPYYMSREQCLGEGVDHRTDIYSFGIVTFEVLTGQLPFYAKEMMSVLMMQMSAEAPAMSMVCPALPPALDAPVRQMMAKDPAARPPSVGEGLELLAAAARDAGFAVEVQPVRREGGTTPGPIARVPTPGKLLTPAERDIASAQTVSATDGRAPSGTPGGAMLAPEAQAVPAGRSRLAGVVGVAVALLLGSGAVAVLLVRGGDAASTGAGSATAVTGEAVVSVAPSAAGTAEPATTSGPGSAGTASTAEVALAIDARPAGVEVYLGDERLGVAPGPIRVARGSAQIQLTFKAAGYVPRTVAVTPSADGRVSVSLVPQGRPGTGQPGKGKGDLEY